MVGHGGSSAGSYLTDPTSPIPSHCTSIVATSTLRVNCFPSQGAGMPAVARLLPRGPVSSHVSDVSSLDLFAVSRSQLFQSYAASLTLKVLNF